MKLFFVHDHPFYEDDEGCFSGGGLPSSVWENYLLFFKEVKVFGRRSNNIKNKKVVSSTKNVSFFLTNNYKSFFSFFFHFFKIRKEISNQIDSADILVARLPSVLGLLAVVIANKKGKRIIVEQVGNAKEAFQTHGSFLGKILSYFFHHKNIKAIELADYICYVTNFALQKSYPSDKFQTEISNVLINNILKSSDVNQAKFSNQVFKIGVIGGFDTKYKGQDTLLKAISILPNSIKKYIKLDFVGKGNYDWLLKEAHRLDVYNNIDFIGGKKSGQEIFDFLSGLTLYIQPSLTEGLPRALIEAMSVGAPVLGSAVGGIPDILEENFLHIPKDYKRLSNQIEYLFNNRNELVNISNSNLVLAEPFLLDNLNAKRQFFYSEILKELKEEKSNFSHN